MFAAMEDAELLHRYVEERSETAFAELVERHLKWVYPLAVRQVGGDIHLAKDVAQSVFTDLALKAKRLTHYRVLAGWLYTSTRYAAAQTIRSERRRVTREHRVYLMNEPAVSAPTHPEESIAPVIDATLAELSPRDRDVLLLRFFRGMPLAELGATLSLTPDAARMRVERALQKTHALLLKRGVTSTAVALAGVLSTQAALAPPVGLAAAISSVAVSSAAAGSTTMLFLMTLSKTKLFVLAAIITGGAATIVVQHKMNTALRRDLDDVRAKKSLAGEEARPVIKEETLLALKASAGKTQSSTLQNGVPSSSEENDRAHPVEGADAAPSVAQTERPLDKMTPMEKLSDVGQGSARAAFETQLWAAHGGDVDRETKAIVLGPKARAKLESLLPSLPETVRADYKTPEQLMAYVLSGTPRPVSAAQVISESQQDADTVIIRAAWQHEGSGEVITNDVRFHRGSEGWQLVISPALVERAVSYLTNKSIPALSRPPEEKD